MGRPSSGASSSDGSTIYILQGFIGGGGDGGGDGGGGLRTVGVMMVDSVEEDVVLPVALVSILNSREPSNEYSVVLFALMGDNVLVNLCTTVSGNE